MISLFLATGALAQSAEVETVAQLRHDLFGEQMLPAYSYLRVHKPTGLLEVDGYLGAEWIAGVDHPGDFDLYRLSVVRTTGDLRWGVGRQRALGSLRGQTFDGARLERDLGDFTVGAWGGVARHQDLDDLLDGSGIGRAEAAWSRRGAVVRLGGQLEAGPETPLVGRQDVLARVRGLGRAQPELGARAVVAESGGVVPEWLQVDGGTRLGRSPVRATVHGAHREAADPTSLFGDALLETLAGDGVDEVGAGARISGASWTSLAASGTLSRYARHDGTQSGYGADASWTSAPGAALRVVPAYRFRAGPGGLFHAAYVVSTADLDDATRLTNRLAAVPYRVATREVWELVLHGGLDLQRDVNEHLRVALMADLATDRIYRYDLRAGAAITVGVP